MLTCKELVAHSSDYLDGQLTLRQRLAVRAHLAMCGNCRRFIRQMKLTQAVIRQMPDEELPELDALAERLVQLGGVANGTTQNLASTTRLPPYPAELLDSIGHVKELSERYAQVGKALRDGIDETDDAGDADTSDLLTELSRDIDKKLWMLEAHLQGHGN